MLIKIHPRIFSSFHAANACTKVWKMGEKCGETFSTENRSNALALMRFFSVDIDSEMNIPTASNSLPAQEISICSKEFVFRIIQLVSINSISSKVSLEQKIA